MIPETRHVYEDSILHKFARGADHSSVVSKVTEANVKKDRKKTRIYNLLKMAGETTARGSIPVASSSRTTRLCRSKRYSPHEAILEYSLVTIVMGLFLLLSIAMKAVSQHTASDKLYV